MYKITITKEETVKTTEREYKKIADTGNKTDNGPVYDYVTYETDELKSKQILDQRVEELDLPAVIKAINKL